MRSCNPIQFESRCFPSIAAVPPALVIAPQWVDTILMLKVQQEAPKLLLFCTEMVWDGVSLSVPEKPKAREVESCPRTKSIYNVIL